MRPSIAGNQICLFLLPVTETTTSGVKVTKPWKQRRISITDESPSCWQNVDQFPAQVWLADDNLLVLKGGSTLDRAGFDDPWQPLDDFQAPYREPVLPPPDFDPDSLEIGVGVDIDILLAERALEKTRREKEARERLRLQQPIIPDIPAFIDPDNSLKPFQDEVVKTHEREFKTFFNDVSQFISDMENFHSARKASARQEVDEPFFKEVPPTTELEVTTPRVREGKHRKSKIELESRKFLPVELPPPSLPPPTRDDETTPAPRLAPFTSFPRNIAPPPVSEENLPAPPTVLREVHHSSSIEVLPKSFRESPPPTTTTSTTPRPPVRELTPAWQQRQTPSTKTTKKLAVNPPTTTPYPLSYSSPHSKVFLSTKYVTHGPSSTPPPSISQSSPRPHQARSQVRHHQSPRPSSEKSRGFTFSPLPPPSSPPPPPPAPVRIFRPRSTTTKPLPPRHLVTTQPRRTPASTTSRPVRRQGSTGPRIHYRDPGVQEDWRPVTSPTTTPPTRTFPGKFNPAPTPYSLFQSVPENIGETDVFHLSQNVDFGKKIESGGGRGLLTNEVDTGFRRHSPSTPFSPAKQIATRGPRLISPKARQPAKSPGGGFRPSFGALPPAKQKAHHPVNASRGRSSLRRRRPKAVTGRQQSVDRAGTGDVRYVSFYSGGAGGNAWGYSYNLG